MSDDALTGLTVLEHPDNVAVRYCGKLFAAHGARVVQASPPPAAGIGYGERASEAFAAWLAHGKTRAHHALPGADLVIGADADRPGPTGAVHLALPWFDATGPYRTGRAPMR